MPIGDGLVSLHPKMIPMTGPGNLKLILFEVFGGTLIATREINWSWPTFCRFHDGTAIRQRLISSPAPSRPKPVAFVEPDLRHASRPEHSNYEVTFRGRQRNTTYSRLSRGQRPSRNGTLAAAKRATPSARSQANAETRQYCRPGRYRRRRLLQLSPPPPTRRIP